MANELHVMMNSMRYEFEYITTKGPQLWLQRQLEQSNSVRSGHSMLLILGKIDALPPVLSLLDLIIRVVYSDVRIKPK